MSEFVVEATELELVGTEWLWRRRGQIDTYTGLDVLLRYNDVGSWSLRVPVASQQAKLLGPGKGLVVWYEGLERPLMSGPVRQVRRTWGPEDNGLGSIEFSGPDDNTLFAERLCFPDRANGLTLPGTNGFGGYRQTKAWDGDDTSYSAERLVHELAYYNMGPGNNAGRRALGVSLSLTGAPSATAYPRTNYKLRFETITEALKTRLETATDSGGNKAPVAYRWVWDQVLEQTVLLVTKPYSDPSLGKGVRFSQEIGNLRSFEYVLAAPRANMFTMGLDQEDDTKPETQNLFLADKRTEAPEWKMTAEIFAEHNDVSLYKRDTEGLIIIGTDDKPIIDMEAINAAIAQDLSEYGPTGSLSIEPIDTAGCMFGRDYWLGDLVTVIEDGEEITDVLREVHITDDGSGPVIIPTIGSPDASETPNLYKSVQRLWTALNRIQRLKQGNRYG